jgi:N4-(beta-N-acetylglucosaminyl)-L-asparaginase
MNRRDFVRTSAATVAVAATDALAFGQAPTMLTPKSIRPLVISDDSGIKFKNGGTMTCVEKAFSMIVSGADVLDALIAGVNIPELDPQETGIGYGGLPNAEGVVQLDASCMHGPLKRAGAVAALEGVRTPSLVARAVMDQTDHHLLVGKGAQSFARLMGFTIEDDLNTETSRKLWLDWKRRVDPDHYLDPKKRGGDPVARADRWYQAGLQMVREGLIPAGSFWGTINCNGINPRGDICGVTTTSGLAWKIPGRVGDSPILGAGLYVDNAVGAAGSTGRGEANLYNLSAFLIVEQMRRGLHPKDAAMEAMKRVKANTVEKRLLNGKGSPNFNLRFFALNAKGEYGGVAMYAAEETTYAICDEKGARSLALDGLLTGSPTD